MALADAYSFLQELASMTAMIGALEPKRGELSRITLAEGEEVRREGRRAANQVPLRLAEQLAGNTLLAGVAKAMLSNLDKLQRKIDRAIDPDAGISEAERSAGIKAVRDNCAALARQLAEMETDQADYVHMLKEIARVLKGKA